MFPPLLNFSSIYIFQGVLIQQKGKRDKLRQFKGEGGSASGAFFFCQTS